MPSRCRQPSTSTSVGKRKCPRTWTANFMCLSNNHQNKVPNSAEKECLYKAGLGLKKVTFEGDAKEQSVHDTLIKAFTKLEQCGGFELLHCNSSCRELKKLNCKWDVKTLKSVVGPQGKFYIRPIQKCLTVEVVTEDEETELMTKCDICKQDVSLGQIRNHVESCIATNLDHTGTYLYTSQGNSDEELPESASEIIHQQGFSMEFHDLPEIASITSMVTLDNVLPGSEDQHNGDYLSTIVKKCTTFCKSNDVSDPIHVLKIFQKEIVIGRPLELTEETSSTGIYGETNFILVDRGDLLKTAIEEIRAISDMRKCLEVQFYGECAADFGGPRKEFFSLVLQCIKEEYFEPVREWSDDYEAVGRILALSTLQNGRLPRIMSAELVEKVFNQVLPVDKYIQDLRKGLDSLGLVQLVQELPAVIHLFTPQQSNPLTVKMLTHLLNPQFSAEGSNRRQRENSTYTLFIKYMREAASGRRGAVNLGSILRFATGTEEDSDLSFALQPSIQFMESANFLPTANTCINRMNLSLPDESNPLPLQEELFNLFDLAFCNTFFGLE